MFHVFALVICCLCDCVCLFCVLFVVVVSVRALARARCGTPHVFVRASLRASFVEYPVRFFARALLRARARFCFCVCFM